MRGPSSQCDSTGPSPPQPLSWAADPHVQQAPSHHCGGTTSHRSAPLQPAPSTTAKSTSFLFLTHTPSCTASSTLSLHLSETGRLSPATSNISQQNLSIPNIFQMYPSLHPHCQGQRAASTHLLPRLFLPGVSIAGRSPPVQPELSV